MPQRAEVLLFSDQRSATSARFQEPAERPDGTTRHASTANSRRDSTTARRCRWMPWRDYLLSSGEHNDTAHRTLLLHPFFGRRILLQLSLQATRHLPRHYRQFTERLRQRSIFYQSCCHGALLRSPAPHGVCRLS